MRLYMTMFVDDAAKPERNEGTSWSGTQADAGKDRKRLKAEGMRNIVTEEVDVPTDKAGLISFLSKWAVVR